MTLEAGKFKSMVPVSAGLSFAEGLNFAEDVKVRLQVSVQIYFLLLTHQSLLGDPILMTSSNPHHYPPKVPASNTVDYEYGGSVSSPWGLGR